MGEITMEIKPEKKSFLSIMTLDQNILGVNWERADAELQQALFDGFEILNITILGDENFTQRIITMKRLEVVE